MGLYLPDFGEMGVILKEFGEFSPPLSFVPVIFCPKSSNIIFYIDSRLQSLKTNLNLLGKFGEILTPSAGGKNFLEKAPPRGNDWKNPQWVWEGYFSTFRDKILPS